MVTTAKATYTGGNIYVYNGCLDDGNHFMASDFFEDKAIMILDADPEQAGEEAYQQDWQDAHQEKLLHGDDAKNFWNEMLQAIIRTNDVDHEEMKMRFLRNA